MTDQSVAIALGWKEQRDPAWTEVRWLRPDGTFFLGHPFFTTSLDAITAEVERRKDRDGDPLQYSLCSDHEYVPEYREVFEGQVGHGSREETAYAPTAPLALCKALLQYIKEGK